MRSFRPRCGLRMTSCGLCVGETDGPPRAALQRAMHGAGVEDEVQPCPRITGEELGGEQVALEAIAAGTCGDDVAGGVGTAVRQRMDVVERGELKVQRRGAVHTAPAAVAHRGALDGSLLVARANLLGATRDSRGSRKGDAVKRPTTGQCHLAKKATPRDGSVSRGGVSW